MEAGGRIVEDTRLDRAGIVVLQVEKVSEGDVLGDLEVVGRQDADLCASVECVGKPLLDDRNTRAHDEAHQQINSVERVVDQAPNQLELQEPIVDSIEQLDTFTHVRLVDREVVALSIDDMTNSTPRVRNVTVIARNHMEMEVVDGLPRGAAGVEAHVVAIGFLNGVEDRLDLVDQRPQVAALII